jgi:RNA polymerase sigma-70 factor (ECF subfamily)
MTCPEVRDRLSAWLDEDLPPAERREVEAHLSGCAPCRQEGERLRRTVALLAGLGRPRAPAGFVDRVLERVEPAPWYRRLARGLFVPVPVKVPLQAAAAVLVAIMAVLVYERTPELSRPPVVPAPVPAARPAEPPAAVEEKARDRGQEFRKERADAERPVRRAETPAVAAAPAESRAQPEAAREAGKRAAAPASPPAVLPAPEPSAPLGDVRGRLGARDTGGPEQELAAVVARLGGSLARRDAGSGAMLVEVTVPREAYADLLRETRRLGAWRLEGEPARAADRVRVLLRLTSAPR